ncbi:MAG: LuxR C-terminal-related transcriptional regulator [Solirubrobacteraceae bacterium]
MPSRRQHLRAISPPPEPERLIAHIDFLRRVGLIRRQLRRATTVGALFAGSSDLACRELGFDRALVLSVEGAVLRADTTDSIRNPDSDRLRRLVLATPVQVRPDVHEAEMIRLMRASQSAAIGTASVVADALELRNFALAPVVVESRTLAILVVDRARPAVQELDVAVVGAFAEMIASALEHVVLRSRQRELVEDLQNLTASTQALMREMVQAPVTLPAAHGQRESYPFAGPVSGDSAALRDRLTEGEARIAALLVQGRSNREIAEELILSTETVKANVARILRKLGVSNRVAAAAAILQPSGSQAA